MRRHVRRRRAFIERAFPPTPPQGCPRTVPLSRSGPGELVIALRFAIAQGVRLPVANAVRPDCMHSRQTGRGMARRDGPTIDWRLLVLPGGEACGEVAWCLSTLQDFGGISVVSESERRAETHQGSPDGTATSPGRVIRGIRSLTHLPMHLLQQAKKRPFVVGNDAAGHPHLRQYRAMRTNLFWKCRLVTCTIGAGRGRAARGSPVEIAA